MDWHLSRELSLLLSGRRSRTNVKLRESWSKSASWKENEQLSRKRQESRSRSNVQKQNSERENELLRSRIRDRLNNKPLNESVRRRLERQSSKDWIAVQVKLRRHDLHHVLVAKLSIAP